MPLTVEQTIGVDGRILTGLPSLETQKAGRQNAGDFGQVIARVLNQHAPLNVKRSERVHDFT
jgi:hypothetical protein